jgi:hypothetical protein
VFRGKAGKETGDEEEEVAKNNLRHEIKPRLREFMFSFPMRSTCLTHHILSYRANNISYHIYTVLLQI